MSKIENSATIQLATSPLHASHPELDPDTRRKLELAEIYARIYADRRRERRKEFAADLIRLWPLALGLLLAPFAPRIQGMLAPCQPWGEWIVFPFAALARRPELQFSSSLAGIVPVIMLYAQFPLEGLLARMALKKRVTVKGVARHMFYMHFLTSMELCMVSNVFWRLATLR